MKIASTTHGLGLLFASAAFIAIATAQAQQESTTSFSGPPKQIDENATPAGVGFNQTGGELSSTALEQAAIGNATVHYHYYGAPTSKQASGSENANGNASATGGTSASHAGTPVPSVPSTTPGYANNSYVTPITNSMNTSWHLYQGNIGGRGESGQGQALGSNPRVGSTNFYMGNGVSGYRPALDNVAYGSGAFVGNWDPYANSGAGSIQGFD